MATVGMNIQAFREKMGLTQEDLATYLGLNNRETISYYENEERAVPIEHLDKLANLFGIESYDLLEGDLESLQAEIAFAFRADEIKSEDLVHIAFCRKIVKNYLKMIRLDKGDGHQKD